MVMNTAVELGERVVRKLSLIRQDAATRRQRERIQKIVSRSEPPQPYNEEARFQQLQREYPPRPEYGYDPLSSWWRAVQHAHLVLTTTQLASPGAHMLDGACGNGMVGAVLKSYGHDITLTDVEDWREARARSLPFVEANLCESLPLESESFDTVFSFNAFIHFDPPERALTELVRVCKPGGLIYLNFGFLYPSPWGLHAYRTLRMPYPQFLFSPEFLQRKIEELGLNAWPAKLGQAREGMIPLNGWHLHQYEEMWRRSGCEVLARSTQEDARHLDLVERFPQAFRGRGLTVSDLTTTLLTVLLRKPGSQKV